MTYKVRLLSCMAMAWDSLHPGCPEISGSEALVLSPPWGGPQPSCQGDCPAQHPQDGRWSDHSAFTPFPLFPALHRGSFLVLLLRECFRDLGWLATIPSVSGEVGLLVTSTVPQTPFFWAMHITEVRAYRWSSEAWIPPRAAPLG